MVDYEVSTSLHHSKVEAELSILEDLQDNHHYEENLFDIEKISEHLAFIGDNYMFHIEAHPSGRLPDDLRGYSNVLNPRLRLYLFISDPDYTLPSVHKEMLDRTLEALQEDADNVNLSEAVLRRRRRAYQTARAAYDVGHWPMVHAALRRVWSV